MTSTASADAEADQNILRQVEYYLSNFSLPTDNFLWKKVHENEEGYVPLDLICTFKKMRGYLNLAGDVQKEQVPANLVKRVAGVLSRSSSLEVNTIKTMVKRKQCIGEREEARKWLCLRTLAVSNLPSDSDQDSLADCFNALPPFDTVRSVRLLREEGTFQGRAHVSFDTEDIAKQVVKEHQGLTYKGAELGLRTAFSHKADPNAADKSNQAGNGRAISKMSVDQGKKADTPAEENHDEADNIGDKEKPSLKRKLSTLEVDSASEDGSSDKFTPGLALKLNLPQKVVEEVLIRHEDLQKAISLLVPGVARVFYMLKAKWGYVRMLSSEKATELLSKCDEQEKIHLDISDDIKVACGLSLLDGDEERLFHLMEKRASSEERLAKQKLWFAGKRNDKKHNGESEAAKGVAHMEAAKAAKHAVNGAVEAGDNITDTD